MDLQYPYSAMTFSNVQLSNFHAHWGFHHNNSCLYSQLKKNQVQVLGTDCEEAQLSQHVRIFIFTFKLACVFLVCSLPYKLAVLLSGLGVHSSVSVIQALGMVRMLYHILDGWTFCANEELLDAMKTMFGGCCCCLRPTTLLRGVIQRFSCRAQDHGEREPDRDADRKERESGRSAGCSKWEPDRDADRKERESGRRRRLQQMGA